MLKIWGRINSGNVQKVLWCVDELGIAYERFDVGGPFGGNKEPAYLAMNPNGLVPTIDDDGLVLWESNSITRYLAAKHAEAGLIPADAGARALVERWMDWQLTVLNGPMMTVFGGLIRTPPEKRDPAAIEAGRKSWAGAWEILDRHLKGKKFLAGDNFTVGDIPAGIMAWRWFNLPIERPDLSNLRAWYERLLLRAPYKKHIALPLS